MELIFQATYIEVNVVPQKQHKSVITQNITLTSEPCVTRNTKFLKSNILEQFLL